MNGPVGWFPDPNGGNGLRYFDGKEWTQIAPPQAAPTPAPAAPPVSVVVNNTSTANAGQASRAGAWVLLFALLCNPWSVLILGCLFFALFDHVGAGGMWLLALVGVAIVSGVGVRRQNQAKQREQDKLGLRAEIENEYDANGDPCGTYGRHLPPEDLEMSTLANLLAQLDPVNNKRKGDQFERISKWFLENDPVYKARFRQVWHFTEWPGRWSNVDLGTDLIAEDYDGEFWAIQAKAYATTSDVNHTDMGKFLADSNRDVISHRMLIATTEGIGRNAEAVFAGQTDKPVVKVMHSRLEAAQVDWPESLAGLRKPAKPLPPKEPRDYQVEAVHAVVDGFTDPIAAR